MTDDLALLAAIRAAPDDDAPRLVYADWLDEHGQTERAEFIRVQCELVRPGSMRQMSGEEIAGLWQREEELITSRLEAICGLNTSPRWVTFDRGFVSGFRDLTLFISRQPDRVGVWTYLLFGDGPAVRTIEYLSVGHLAELVRAYLDEQGTIWAVGRSLREPGMALNLVPAAFFARYGCLVTEGRYTVDPFGQPPTVTIDTIEYRLTARQTQLLLDPVHVSEFAERPSLSFHSFPET